MRGILPLILKIYRISCMHVFQKNALPLHPQNRDVAQLVAHYVRDVGVGRSSRLIPTFMKKWLIIQPLIIY